MVIKAIGASNCDVTIRMSTVAVRYINETSASKWNSQIVTHACYVVSRIILKISSNEDRILLHGTLTEYEKSKDFRMYGCFTPRSLCF